MGYAHYYRYTPDDPRFRGSWPLIVADALRIVDRVQAAGIAISGLDGGAPHVSAGGIAFTGSAEDELVGEGFVIRPGTHRLPEHLYDERGAVWAFCKTERFPYDVAVTAILLRCHLLCPEVFLIDSDGDWDEEWRKDMTCPPTGGLSARGLVTELFGDAPDDSPFTPTTTGPR